MAHLQKTKSPVTRALCADLEADLIDTKTACRVIGGAAKPIHPSTLDRLVKRGLLPAPIQIGCRLRRWSLSKCAALSTGKAARAGGD